MLWMGNVWSLKWRCDSARNCYCCWYCFSFQNESTSDIWHVLGCERRLIGGAGRISFMEWQIQTGISSAEIESIPFLRLGRSLRKCVKADPNAVCYFCMLYSPFSLLPQVYPQTKSIIFCVYMLSFWFLNSCVYIWLLVPHLVRTSVCSTKTQSLPKVFHPVGLDHSSSPFLRILVILFLLAGFSSPGLHELLVPELHLSKRKMCTQLLCCFPPCLSSCRADGKCRISPFPPPASSFLSCSSPVQFFEIYLMERTFSGRGGEQTQAISLCVCSPVCLFLQADTQPLKLDILGSQQRDSFWKG